MRLARLRHPDHDFPLYAQVHDDRVVTLVDQSTVIGRLQSGDRSRAVGQTLALEDVEFLAPHQPGAIYAVGRNYPSHIAELGNETPRSPLIFMKPPTSVVGPNGPVVRPAIVEQLDYEVELAVVLGRMPDGTIGPAGFAVANDLTARDLQAGDAHWTRAKGADTFCPFGPWVTTAEDVPDPGALRLRSWVNGELRQDGSTADMIFGIDTLIEHLAATISLQPGDLLLTGTPSGVGHATERPDGAGRGAHLKPGDVIRLEIEGLGAIEHAVVAAADPAAADDPAEDPADG